LKKNVVECQNDNENPSSLYIACVNAINCGRSIMKILDQAINPILNQYDYHEMSVRIGIDFGENSVIQDGWDLHSLSKLNRIKKVKTEIIRASL
jgi:adenylate cyclase